MASCCWIADGPDPPWQWDLRRRGWSLCRRSLPERRSCADVDLLDARGLSPAERAALPAPWPARSSAPRSDAAPAHGPVHNAALWPRPNAGPARLIVLGVDDSAERARLLSLGCAEALPADTALDELMERAQRVVEQAGLLPRWRTAGPLTLDLFHRDARLGRTWLSLHPREFAVLWRLADEPGRRVTRRELLRDVWRIHHEPETNSVEVHVSRLRSKLAGLGCEALVETAAEGGYRLVPDRPLPSAGEAEHAGPATSRISAVVPTQPDSAEHEP